MKYLNSQKGMSPILAIIVLAVIFIGGAYLFKQQQTKQASNSNVTDATANWKTYTDRNRDRSVSFSYPSSWKSTDIYLEPFTITKPGRIEKSISVELDYAPIGFNNWCKNHSPCRSYSDTCKSHFKQVTFANKEAYQYNPINDHSGCGYPTTTLFILLPTKDKIAIISKDVRASNFVASFLPWSDQDLIDAFKDPIFDQILSTFKFTDSQALTSQAILNLSNDNLVAGGARWSGYHLTVDKNSIIFGDLDGDGINEAIAVVSYCSASCGRSVYVFKLYQEKILLTEIPQTSVGGAAQAINSLQVKNGLVVVAETDLSGTRTTSYRVQLVNGKLVSISL